MNTILGETKVAQFEVARWLRGKGVNTVVAHKLIPLYWRYAPSRGVRPEAAFVQFCHETGWGRFGGVVDEDFNNPCGLKVSAGGDNLDPDAHAKFPTWAMGVIAHLDHLALYAGAPSYPRRDTPDPRHYAWIFGRARTLEGLGGQWAPSQTYGNKLAALLKSLLEAS